MASEALDLAVVNGTVVFGHGRYRLAIGVKDGKVVALAPRGIPGPGSRDHRRQGPLHPARGRGQRGASRLLCALRARHDHRVASRSMCGGHDLGHTGTDHTARHGALQGGRGVLRCRLVQPVLPQRARRDQPGQPCRRLPHIHARDRRTGPRDPPVRRGARRHLLQALPADARHEGHVRRCRHELAEPQGRTRHRHRRRHRVPRDGKRRLPRGPGHGAHPS